MRSYNNVDPAGTGGKPRPHRTLRAFLNVHKKKTWIPTIKRNKVNPSWLWGSGGVTRCPRGRLSFCMNATHLVLHQRQVAYIGYVPARTNPAHLSTSLGLLFVFCFQSENHLSSDLDEDEDDARSGFWMMDLLLTVVVGRRVRIPIPHSVERVCGRDSAVAPRPWDDFGTRDLSSTVTPVSRTDVIP